MLNAPIWMKLTEEQCKLLGSPSDETFNWMVEAHRNMLAHRCLDAAATKWMTQLEEMILDGKKLLARANRDTLAAQSRLGSLVTEAHAFVDAVSAQIQEEATERCIFELPKTQAVIDRFRSDLGEYQ